jgi:hypothetical protein
MSNGVRHSLKGSIRGVSTARARGETRYTFTPQLLLGAALLTRKAHGLEAPGSLATDEHVIEHRAYVVGAVTQAAASLESDVAEILMYGPGSHLGSDNVDSNALKALEPVRDRILRSKGGVLARYKRILKELGYGLSSMPKTNTQVALLVLLRDELMHYRSELGGMTKEALLHGGLQRLRLAPPPFASPLANFFPHRCLSASLASWAVQSTATFINGFQAAIGVRKSLLASFESQLQVPDPKLVSRPSRTTGR